MLTIKKSHLQAALICSAKKDIRTYLNGVLLHVGVSGANGEPAKAYLVSIDGARAFVGRFDPVWIDAPQVGPFDIIIPNDAINLAIKSLGRGMETLALVATPDGKYKLGPIEFTPVEFTPVDGKYPDINRVIPDPKRFSNEPAQFRCQYLFDAERALQTWSGNKHTFTLRHNGENAAYMSADDAFVIIMPIRASYKGADHGTFTLA